MRSSTPGTVIRWSKEDTNDNQLKNLRLGTAAADESSAFAEMSAKQERRRRGKLKEARPEAMKRVV